MSLDRPSRPSRIWIGVFVLGMLVLVYLSLFSEFMPPYRRLYGPITLDNVLHFVAFAILGVVAPMAFKNRVRALVALIFLLLVGFSLEFWQIYLPNRRCELLDAAANGLGLLVGGCLGLLIRTGWEKRSSRRLY